MRATEVTVRTGGEESLVCTPTAKRFPVLRVRVKLFAGA